MRVSRPSLGMRRSGRQRSRCLWSLSSWMHKSRRWRSRWMLRLVCGSPSTQRKVVLGRLGTGGYDDSTAVLNRRDCADQGHAPAYLVLAWLAAITHLAALPATVLELVPPVSGFVRALFAFLCQGLAEKMKTRKWDLGTWCWKSLHTLTPLRWHHGTLAWKLQQRSCLASGTAAQRNPQPHPAVRALPSVPKPGGLFTAVFAKDLMKVTFWVLSCFTLRRMQELVTAVLSLGGSWVLNCWLRRVVACPEVLPTMFSGVPIVCGTVVCWPRFNLEFPAVGSCSAW